MNPLQSLHEQGQSFWLDFISRSLINSGELKRLVENDGLRGVTSNPSIFQKAIGTGSDYDESIRQVLRSFPDADESVLYEHVAVEDIQLAADVLRPVYERSEHADGFVSFEVSPHLAHDTDGTVVAALDHWRTVARPNVMIKVPATREGIPAIAELSAQGVNINATLIFSLAHYEAVAQAYVEGLARCHKPQLVASVASFFVSRVDTTVDKLLERAGKEEALALRGTAAVANAKLAYQRFQEIFHGAAFAALRARGARAQRLLWGSTGTKNPAYSDVKYVDELIGPETVNTMPLPTVDAFRAHGRVAPTLAQGLDVARRNVSRLRELGIELNEVGEQLQREGVKQFADAFDDLLNTLKQKYIAQ